MLMASTLRFVMRFLLCAVNNTSFKQIDIGEETGPRTVVSGLVNYIPIEQMRNRRLIAVVRVFLHNHMICTNVLST